MNNREYEQQKQSEEANQSSEMKKQRSMNSSEAKIHHRK